MSARLSRRIFTRPLCALLSNVIWGEVEVPTCPRGMLPTPRSPAGSPRGGELCQRTHGDGEGVTVRDLVVDDGLDVDGFQLELDGDIDESAGKDVR